MVLNGSLPYDCGVIFIVFQSIVYPSEHLVTLISSPIITTSHILEAAVHPCGLRDHFLQETAAFLIENGTLAHQTATSTLCIGLVSTYSKAAIHEKSKELLSIANVKSFIIEKIWHFPGLIPFSKVYFEVSVECIAVMIASDSPDVQVFEVRAVSEKIHDCVSLCKCRPLLILNIDVVSCGHKEIDLSSFACPVTYVGVDSVKILDGVTHIWGPTEVTYQKNVQTLCRDTLS
jgi:hypothetical protein